MVLFANFKLVISPFIKKLKSTLEHKVQNDIIDILESELKDIISAYTGESLLTVGFNRRFAPVSALIKNEIDKFKSPIIMNFRVNGGHIPNNHWIQDPGIGGGRIIGEEVRAPHPQTLGDLDALRELREQLEENRIRNPLIEEDNTIEVEDEDLDILD